MLLFATFSEFRDGTTLLLWGDEGDLVALRTLLAGLASGERSEVALEHEPWAKSVAGERLRLSVADGGRGALSVRETGGRQMVDWACSPDQWGDFAEKVDALAHSERGHQYLDAPQPMPLQVMVSKGEYPADLKPG